MRNINPTFTDEEFTELEEIKDKSDLNWHDLVYDALKLYDR